MDRLIHHSAHAKAEKDSLFHPTVYAPTGLCCGVGFGGARFSIVEGGFELAEERDVVLGVALWWMIEELRNLRTQVFE